MLTLLKHLIRYRTLPIRALFHLIRAHWQVHHTPFKHLSPHLGKPQQSAEHPIDPHTLKDIQKISAAVQKMARWCHFKCFAQAIAAQRLLKQKNIASQLYLGVNKQEDQLKAHAWLKCGNVFVTGKRGFEAFTSVICYHSLSA